MNAPQRILWTYSEGDWASPAKWVRHVANETPRTLVVVPSLRGLPSARLDKEELDREGSAYSQAHRALYHAEPELRDLENWIETPDGYERRARELSPDEAREQDERIAKWLEAHK